MKNLNLVYTVQVTLIQRRYTCYDVGSVMNHLSIRVIVAAIRLAFWAS